MSYSVATMKKLKSSDLGGIQIESDRQYDDPNAYKNEVDLERSKLNVELVESHDSSKGGLKRETEKYILENKQSTKKTRKDAVVLNSWIITSDQKFFDNLTQEQQLKYFEDAKEWFGNRYGDENIMHATVHFDETTPHMHMGIVPLREGKLTSKTIMTPIELSQVQEQFPEFMASKGWNIERGVKNSERKHLDAPEYREATKQAKELQEQNKALRDENIALQDNMKDETLDVLEQIAPRLEYTREAYDKKKSESSDKDEFVKRYGDTNKQLQDPQGRNQIKDWTTLEVMQKLIKEQLDKLKEHAQNLKTKYEEIKTEIQGLKQEKENQEKELNELRELYGEKKLEKTQDAQDFFNSFSNQVDTERRDQELHEKQMREHEQQNRNSRDMGGFSR